MHLTNDRTQSTTIIYTSKAISQFGYLRIHAHANAHCDVLITVLASGNAQYRVTADYHPHSVSSSFGILFGFKIRYQDHQNLRKLEYFFFQMSPFMQQNREQRNRQQITEIWYSLDRNAQIETTVFTPNMLAAEIENTIKKSINQYFHV